MAAFVFRFWHTGSTCMVLFFFVDVGTQTCCSNVVDMSIMPFVEFLKEFYPLLTAIYCNAPDLVKHCLLNLVFSIDTI